MVRVFERNPYDQRLRLHKLQGDLTGFYSISVDFRHRIICRLIENKTARFYDIGTHDIYE